MPLGQGTVGHQLNALGLTKGQQVALVGQGNLADARLSTVGRDVSVTALATGSWDSVAKLEAMLGRLEREEGLKLIWYRTGPKPIQSNLLTYVVEVVAADKPGILFQLADFFDRQGITVENLQCSRYRAMQTGADMFSAHVTIGVPAMAAQAVKALVVLAVILLYSEQVRNGLSGLFERKGAQP